MQVNDRTTANDPRAMRDMRKAPDTVVEAACAQRTPVGEVFAFYLESSRFACCWSPMFGKFLP